MLPFVSSFTIGGDYIKFPIRHQMEFLFSIKTGSFPLYVPGFASGHSVTALTLGQPFHTLTWMVSIMPGYWEGRAIEWNNLFKLLSLGLTQLILYILLRRLGVDKVLSFALSFITVYTLRMINLFQYGAALEAYTGYLILCALIGLYCVNPKGVFLPLGIVFTTYLLICSGHPEEMYYGLLAGGIFAIIAPSYVSVLLPDARYDLKRGFRFWLMVGFLLSLGVMLSSVYIIPFYFEFFKLNIHRVGMDYDTAILNTDTFIGTINNFFLPLRSHVRSAFGGASLFLLPMFLPVLRFFNIKIPRCIWILWAVIVIFFLYMLGNRTPVHRILWEYLPFASAIRLPGRISIIVPFFIMLLIVWIIRSSDINIPIKESSGRLSPITIMSIISLMSIILYYATYILCYYVLNLPQFLNWFHPYYEGNFLRFGISYEQVELCLVLLGLLSFVTMILIYYAKAKKVKGLFGLVLIAVILLQVGITLRYRSYNWIIDLKNLDIPSFNEMR
ncbi:MAG: hypothetical protein QXT99_09830, partial [Candidatus Nitrosotenuis sp.]